MSNTSKYRVLVVDDEPSIRESMAMLLRQAEGYEVSTAEHGFDALLQLRREIPDVIISDLNMPQMSGFEFLSVVRRRRSACSASEFLLCDFHLISRIYR